MKANTDEGSVFEIRSLECAACGEQTPLIECMSSLVGGAIVHTCSDPECLRAVDAAQRMHKGRTANEQPLPVLNTSTPIIDLVLPDVGDPVVRADLIARVAVGVGRYGTKLQAHNGRDALRDAYDEDLDGIMYKRQAFEEETDEAEGALLWALYLDAIEMAERTSRAIQRRNLRRPRS